jgi:hypothetical protein
MSNKRLEMLLLNRGGELQDKNLLDCYNQTFVTDVAYTITTRINTSDLYWVYEIVYSASD